jgi:hypothetical protein
MIKTMMYIYNTGCTSFCICNYCVIESSSRSLIRYLINFSINDEKIYSCIEGEISYVKYKNSKCLTLSDIEEEIASILK